MKFRKRRKKNHEFNPEDIFLDSSNLPQFEEGRLEGRLERPISDKTYNAFLLIVIVIFFIFVVQAGSLEVVQGEKYASQSERNRLRPEIIFPNRGAILDRFGVVLATNEKTPEGETMRTYKTPGFAHLLGYVSTPRKDDSGNYYDTTITGLAGVEKAFDASLAGTNGLLLIEEDARGKVESQGSVLAPVDGTPLSVSIDARAQEAFASTVKELADRIPFDGGVAILMDIETGELRALVSYPEYDPNILSEGSDRQTISGYNTDERQVYLDRAISGLYAPGSVVKPIVAAGALTDKIISPEKIIVSTGSISIPNIYNPDQPTIFPDWKALGPMDMRSAIAWSSDVYFYTIGGGYGDQKGLGIDRLGYWYKLFGLDSGTNIELGGEVSGFIPTQAWKEETYDEPWRIGNTYHTSIGQYAMQVTPMEMLRAIAAIANGGKLVNPTILKDGPLSGESIAVDQEALQIVREGMRKGVTEGTAKGLSFPFVDVAAKTGTAQLGSLKQYVNAWVVGFFPYDKPKYAFAVVMEKGPQSNLVGGVYVAANALLKLRDTAPDYFE